MGLFKSYSEREVKRVKPIVDKINALEPEMQKLTDSELRAKKDEFKKMLADGKTLDDILPVSYTHLDVYKRQVLSKIGVL